MMNRRSLGGGYGSLPINGGTTPQSGGGPPMPGGMQRRRLPGAPGGGAPNPLGPPPMPQAGPALDSNPMGPMNPANAGSYTGAGPVASPQAGLDPQLVQLLKQFGGGR